MEQAQRANAAQLAARKIRDKPRPRRAASQTPTPTTQQQFGAMQTPSQNGGSEGLFGGSIKAAGEFSFSAPTQGLSFPAPSFGSRSTTMNIPSQDASNSDGRFAGDDRATKRQFGGASTIQQSNSAFQISNPFGQSQPSNPFDSMQPSGGSVFSFGASQQSGSAGISFNSGSTNASANNPFNFQPTAQSTSTTPSSFGSNPFNFNPQPAQTPGPFGSAPAAQQDKPANSPFLFGQTSGQPSTSSTMFGAPPATNVHTSNIFGSAPLTATTPQLSNVFSSTTTPTTPKNNLFGSTPSTVLPAGSLAGTSNALLTQDKPTSSSLLFGQASTNPSSAGVFFSSTPASSNPTGEFLGANKPLETAVSSQKSSEIPMQQAPSSNPFAHLNASVASPISNVSEKQDQKAAAPATSNTFGALHTSQASGTTSFFGKTTPATTIPNQSTPFGQQQSQPATASTLIETFIRPPESTTESKIQDQQTSIGSVFVPENKAKEDLFGNLNKPVDQLITNPKVNGISSQNSDNSSIPFNKPASVPNLFGALKSGPTGSPAMNNDQPISTIAQTSSANGNIFSPTKPINIPASASQLAHNSVLPSLEQVTSTPRSVGSSVKSSTLAAFATGESVERGDSRSREISARKQIREASEMKVESVAPFMPESYTGFQKMAFHQGYRLRAMNRAMSTFFASINPDEDVTSILEFYMEQREVVVADTAALKRKTGEDAERVDNPSKRLKQSVEITPTEPREPQSKRKLDDEDQENENPNKRTRQAESTTAARGVTGSEVVSNGQAFPRGNVNNTPAWQAPSSGVSSISNASMKRKAGDQITKDTVQRNPLRPVQTPPTNGTLDSNMSGSSTSNLFKNILDSPSKPLGSSSPDRKMAALPEAAKNTAPRVNAFANLPGASTGKPAPITSSSTFAAKVTTPALSASSPNLFTTSAAPAAPSSFTPKLTTPSSAVAGQDNTDQKSNGVKPPVFGNPTTNFQIQFAQLAEEEALKKAIEDDYDSDDDLEEFKANFKAERLRKKRALEESPKNAKGFTFVPSASASSNGEEKSHHRSIFATQPSAFPNSLLGQNQPSHATNSGPNSLTGSRTPTPASDSSPRSVLDGHTTGKPMKPEGIFGFLANASGNDANAVASKDSDDEASEAEEDSERKDPTYQPDGESASGPGTPAEETGPGLASVKKPSSISSALGSVSPSGSSTPTRGSLFDRVGKIGDVTVGRPKFDDEDKEKENTQPSVANPFAALNKPLQNNAVAPSDQTWKNDSPIRFGSATPSKDAQQSTPTVSVTAATPSKIGNPSSIFNELNKTTGAAPKPFSNLFGNLGGENKPAAPISNMFGNLATGSTSGSVGFGFGVPSASSSLFPSAAVSASTSRATTPGGTTDGDNSGEGEADQEQHVPFNLSARGPGEEDEEVLHEVRAKALKYVQKPEGGNPWESKGVGPLRVLKHRETGASRILLRMDPTGLVILNKGILSGVKYESKEKTVKFLTALDEGSGLETWLLQVKTPEIAKALAEVLEANKPT